MTIESRISNLFRDYLTLAPFSSGVPDGGKVSGTLIKRAQDDAGEISHPILICSTDSQQTTRKDLARLTLNLKLCASVGEEGIAPSLVSEWIASIRRYIDNADAWLDFIVSLSDAERSGFRIIWQRIGAPVVFRDSDAKILVITLPVNLRVITQD